MYLSLNTLFLNLNIFVIDEIMMRLEIEGKIFGYWSCGT